MSNQYCNRYKTRSGSGTNEIFLAEIRSHDLLINYIVMNFVLEKAFNNIPTSVLFGCILDGNI